MFTFEPVPPLHVRAAWPAVRAQLGPLLAADPQHWCAEDVFVELTRANSYLHWVVIDGERQGFMVARPTAEYDSVVLFVWIFYVPPQALKNGGFEDGMTALLELARSIGAKRIRHESRRNGWLEKGFELKQHVYEREV